MHFCTSFTPKILHGHTQTNECDSLSEADRFLRNRNIFEITSIQFDVSEQLHASLDDTVTLIGTVFSSRRRRCSDKLNH